jgi:uncharacterized membrane protein YccC
MEMYVVYVAGKNSLFSAMDYLREYKSFLHSHNLYSAVRITAGITLPAILLGYFNNLPAGIALSLGAMCVGNMGNPGPIHHRRNGMFVCVASIFIVALLTGLAAGSPLLMGMLVFVFCFVFSMIGIYGARAGSIGVNALLIMVLTIDRPLHGWAILVNAAYILAGGLWYTVLSLLLYSFRPYKLTQQALGDSIQATAGYLRVKASFYSGDIDYDKSYRQLMEQQIENHEKQDLVRELLFKSRDIVGESTHTGRVLVMIFLDIVDLFERVMTSQQDYRLLHRLFDRDELSADGGTVGHGNILEQYRLLILDLADDLDEIGIAIRSGRSSAASTSLPVRIRELRDAFSRFMDRHRTAENAEGIIGLHHILDSIQDIADRLHTLHGYTTYDIGLSKGFRPPLDYEQFVTHQETSGKLLMDNLTLHSNIFRHSLRVSIAIVAGHLVSVLLPFGHSYWILLTIIVIMKPAYSLTKRRNFERLAGTLAGAVAGLAILWFIKDRTVLFILMIVFMIGTYSFLRTRYLLAVALMTPYILLVFHLLYPSDFRTILSDRVLDTAIGSVIAFLANIFLFPSWEHERMTDFMIAIIKANARYFSDIAGAFAGNPPTITQYKLSRKQAFVALANLSDAFNRMLSEPRRKQKDAARMHQFVVSNHMLTSHVATLAYYGTPLAAKYADPGYQPIIQAVTGRLEGAVAILQHAIPRPPDPPPGAVEAPPGTVQKEQADSRAAAASKGELRLLNEKRDTLMDQRKADLDPGLIESDTRRQASEFKPVIDQFNFIVNVSSDIEKLSRELASF